MGNSQTGAVVAQEATRGRVLRTADAAAYLGFARATLAKLRCVGGGPEYVKLGRLVVYRVEQLDSWIDAHGTRRNTSEAPRAA